MLSKRDDDRLRRGTTSFVEFMRASPLVGLELELERDRSPARAVGSLGPPESR